MAQFYGGPVYCETPPDPAAWSFPIEPFNTISNGVIVLFGLFGLYSVWRRSPRAADLYVLSALLIATGIGSGIWHGFRDGTALGWEVMSGLYFLFALVFCWARRLWSYAGALIALAVFYFGFQWSRAYGDGLVAGLGIGGRWVAITPLVVVTGTVMIVQTAFRSRQAAASGAVALGLALVAVTFRTIDLSVCEIWPTGTHFLWHGFLSAGGFFGILTLTRLKAWSPKWLRRRSSAAPAAAE